MYRVLANGISGTIEDKLPRQVELPVPTAIATRQTHPHLFGILPASSVLQLSTQERINSLKRELNQLCQRIGLQTRV